MTCEVMSDVTSARYARGMPQPATAIGPLLRRWRSSRGLSQLALAQQAEVSTRPRC
jgi:predicted transcriptional regulator